MHICRTSPEIRAEETRNSSLVKGPRFDELKVTAITALHANEHRGLGGAKAAAVASNICNVANRSTYTPLNRQSLW